MTHELIESAERPRFRWHSRSFGPALALTLAAVTCVPVAAQERYFPERGGWEWKASADVGLDADALAKAVVIVSDPANEGRGANLAFYQARRHHQPLYQVMGPMKSRGDLNGIIIRNGYVVAEWGDTGRVDITQSVSKSFLSIVVGLAYDRKMIASVDDKIYKYMAPVVRIRSQPIRGNWSRLEDQRPYEPFETQHNRTITWDHMLRQTSDWEGEIWDLPDWADRPEKTKGGQVDEDWIARKRHPSGTVYKYSDVRVNALSLAALNVWRKPLPQVLKDEVMDPIGASNTWRWFGYENSWIELDGQAMQSVAGGAHYGGGMNINTWDMARFGYLMLNGGNWKGTQLISKDWLAKSRVPGVAKGDYGYMNFYLNTGRKALPAAPESAFWFQGAGENRIYIDSENDLVVVTRWLSKDTFKDFIAVLLKGIEKS